MRHTRTKLLAALLGALLFEQAVFAQPAPPPPAPPAAPAPSAAPSAQPAAAPSLGDTLTGPAKTEYDLGKILYRDGDYAGAIVKFQKSYDLSKEPRLLWNVVACEKNLRHYAKALVLLAQYDKEAGPKLNDDEKEQSRALGDAMKQFVSTVTIEVNEPGAKVLVDEVEVGTSPLPTALTLDFGDRKIRVVKDGFVEESRTEKLTGATATKLAFTMKREVHEGKVAITAGASDVISVDGAVVGTGHYEATLKSGPHTLRVTANGMRAYQGEMLVQDNQTRQIPITLEAMPKGGVPWAWLGGGAAVIAAGVVGGYFLFRSRTGPAQPGTIDPFVANPQGFRFGGAR